MSELIIRAATADEFATAVDWAAAENWNPDWTISMHSTIPIPAVS